MTQKLQLSHQMEDYNKFNMLCKLSIKQDPQLVIFLFKLGILTKEGVVLATEKHEVSFLLE
jgi:hypothetical protein